MIGNLGPELDGFIAAMKDMERACNRAEWRTCPTYSYWHDLKTDLRRPTSWLDLANMILRRLRLVLVRNADHEMGETLSWQLRGWLDFLDDIHEQGRCEVCRKEKA